MDVKTLKTMRINLVIFATLQFFYTVATSPVGPSGIIPAYMFGRILIQYWISSWIIRKFVIKTKEKAKKIVLYTWLVSGAVFIARIALGIILSIILTGLIANR